MIQGAGGMTYQRSAETGQDGAGLARNLSIDSMNNGEFHHDESNVAS